MLRRSWIVLLVALAPALAQAEPNARELAHARGLFDEAVLAEEDEDWELAAAKLREAISIKETAGLRFHLAYCEEHRGRLVEAFAEYERAAELAEADPKSGREVRKQVGPNREALRERMPKLTIEVSEEMSLATLRLNDAVLSPSQLGVPIFQNPGTHRLVILASGYEPFISAIELSEGESRVYRLDSSMMTPLSPAPAPAPSIEPHPDAPASASSPSRGLRSWALLTEGVVAAAGLGVGIGYQVAAASSDRDADAARRSLDVASAESNAQCGSPSAVIEAICDDLSRAVTTGKSRQNVATIGFVTAGAGTAALVATWLLWPSDTPSSATGPRILPTTLHGKPALSFSGVF